MKNRLTASLACLLIMVATILSSASTSQAADVSDAEHRIRRLYWAIVAREGDKQGIRDWTQRFLDGMEATTIANHMIFSREGRARFADGSTPVEGAYRDVLGREPDALGLRTWSQVSLPVAMVRIANSREMIQNINSRGPVTLVASDLRPKPTPPRPSHPAGWVDAGHGVYVPPVLISIRRCESRGNYRAVNRSSGASGAYQFIKSSWRGYGHRDRYGVSTAAQASPAQQDEAAVITYQRSGTRPWLASRHCWR